MLKQIFFRIILFAIVAIMLVQCKSNEPYEILIASDGEIGWKKEYCEISYGNLTYLAEIKCRGGYSSKFEKHSYTIDFNDKIELGGLPKAKKYILNANYIDKTFMRHVLCYDLYREMNPAKNVAPLCKYTNLTIDSIYNGLYVLMQHIDADMLDLDKLDSMAMLFKEPPVFKDDTSTNYDQKFPKKKKCDMSIYMDEFKNFLFKADDATFAREIGERIDIENVIDWHILLLFSNGEDGIKKNFFLYKKDSSTPYRIALWDCDHSFGRDGDNELNLMRSEIDCSRNIMLKRLLEIPEIGYEKRLCERYKELRDSKIISAEHINEKIAEYNSIIQEDVERNFALWPVNSPNYFDDNTYEQELEIIREFVEIRLPQLDKRFGYVKN
ncbi:MAG: CotH kinase family protein [Bacteroidales bacterium]|nr:CotH kinase family protein [Bacteroidales bacterium]